MWNGESPAAFMFSSKYPRKRRPVTIDHDTQRVELAKVNPFKADWMRAQMDPTQIRQAYDRNLMEQARRTTIEGQRNAYHGQSGLMGGTGLGSLLGRPLGFMGL